MYWKLATRFFVLCLITIVVETTAFAQTTTLSFTSIPISDPDLNAPGRGIEQWHYQNVVNVPVEGVNTDRLDAYHRFVWTKIEGSVLGSYTWQYFDSLVNNAILKKQKISFGIMPLYPGGTSEQGLVSFDGGLAAYPLYLHTLMQSETVKDWKTGTVWTPNYNSTYYQNRLLALHQAIDAHLKTTSFNGVLYKNVIGYIDLRGYGAWGEWHSGYTVNNSVSDYPAGTFPTIASLKKIVDAYTQGFPDYPLVAMISAFDANWLQNTMNPPEIAYYILTQRNNWGLIGWRRDQWGASDSYVSSYLENNTRSFAGLVFKDSIMARWKTAPITGEPPGWNPNNFADLESQVRLYHANSFGNGNYGTTPTSTIKSRVRASSKACGYRLVIESGSMTKACRNISITLNWKNVGLAPAYEQWDVLFQLKNAANAIAWTGSSQFKPKLFLPATTASAITDNFTLPADLPAGSYNLTLAVKDPNGYRDPLPLAITGRNTDGSYTLSQITIAAGPAISVANNCNNSVITATGYTGTLLWSTGATSPTITITEPGNYSVTQTINGCPSAPTTAMAAPLRTTIPAPAINATNNCGSSLLTATGFTGSLLWSTGETTNSITVTTAGTYSVAQIVNGCTGPPGSVAAAPTVSALNAPIVDVVNNCNNSVLTATRVTGSLLWSTGETSNSITVTTAGTYSVTQTENGCSSPPGSGTATPKILPPAPQISATNNCGNSILTAAGVLGSLLWSTGETANAISVSTGGTYTVSQTVDGCTSTLASQIVAPKSIPLAPGILVVNNCGSSILTATGVTGTLLWSTGETSNYITVTTGGMYTVSQTVDGCTSLAAIATAAPLIPMTQAPELSVVNNCGSSVLTATGVTGTLLWSTGETTNSITVSATGIYSAIQTENGCSSIAASVTAAPKSILPAPGISVINNCENSVLTATDVTGSLLWSTGETTNSITVVTPGLYTVSQAADGCSSALASQTATPKAIPTAPDISVINNCGNSVLTATGVTGTLLWSTGETTNSITVTTEGTYTVSQTVDGCASPNRSEIASPLISTVAPPEVSVVNNCGSSVLTATASGPVLWSTGETTNSITVITPATYSVTQTEDGCSSAAASITAAPKPIPPVPGLSVTNNCESSTLTATGITGSLLWSTGETSSSITVSTAGAYSVTQGADGCISLLASQTAAPKSIPSPPDISVVNNCGNSVLTATGVSGSVLWNTGQTTTSIAVAGAGTYTATQTVDGCTSALAGTVAAPKIIPNAPGVLVVNNCGSSILTANGFSGTLLWNNGSTSSSITVTVGGTYTVTQAVDGCTSPAGGGLAVPNPIPVLSSNLSAAATSGNAFSYAATSTIPGTTFSWSRAAVPGISNPAANGAGNINETLINTTTSPVNVTYVYTLSVNGCTNTQNVDVTVNPISTINCVINGSISSGFNSTSIPAGRSIWFSSAIDKGSITGVNGTIIFTITNSKITFTSNGQQYVLNVPDSRIRFDAAVTTATTQFINNKWETAVPRAYNGYVFMGGLSYQVLTSLPGNISNVTWTAKISIDKAGMRPTWKWAAAVYSSFAGHSGLNVKPKNGKDQNPYSNNDDAGTPENYKSFVVAGAKGTGGTNYIGSYSTTNSATCSTVGQRSTERAISEHLIVKEIPGLTIESPGSEKLNAVALPNPSNSSFTLILSGQRKNLVSVKVMDISGRVLERYDRVLPNTRLRLGQRLAAGSYFIEITQGNRKKTISVIKVN